MFTIIEKKTDDTISLEYEELLHFSAFKIKQYCVECNPLTLKTLQPALFFLGLSIVS